MENVKNKSNGFFKRHADGEADLKMPKKARNILNKKGVRIAGNYFFVVLSFVIPFVMMALAFAAQGIVGFSSDGDKQILVIDCWHQYFPFLQEMQDKLQNGGSLLYTWRSGMGSNFLATMSYYTASPLNFLTIFLPSEHLREFLALFVCIKIGCAGMFMSIFLRGVFKRNDFTIVLFAIPYALSAYFMGYYWNVMWLDTVALAPLVFLGTYSLVREGRYKMYVISLAVAFFSNFYIGFFVCVFVIFVFIATNIILRPGFKMFFKRFGQIALFTAIALGMTAILVLPAYIALQHAYSANSTFPTTYKLYDTFANVISNTLAFQTPSHKEGLPNLYCGFLSIVVLGATILCNKISIREKIVDAVIIGFLILSVNFNVLDYIWNGFHFTNMIPFRFSFLFAFAVLTIAYRAFTQLDRAHWIMVLGSAVVLAAVLIVAKQADVDDETFNKNLILGICYMACILLIALRFINTKAAAFIMIFPLMFELNANVTAGTTAVGTSTYSTYYSSGEGVEELLDEYESGDDDFYRIEMSKSYTINDPALYQYRGISMFSSMINCDTSQYLHNLGILASQAGNRYYYAATTPFTNAILNLKYTICKSGTLLDTQYNTLVDSADGVTIYENNAYLPLGFMCNDDIADMDVTSTIPFYYQNQLFKAMTGSENSIFYYVPMTGTDGCINCEVTSEEKNTGFHTFAPTSGSTGVSLISEDIILNDSDKEVDGVAAGTIFELSADELSDAADKSIQVTFEYMDDKATWADGANIEYYSQNNTTSRRTITNFEFEEGKSVQFTIDMTDDILNSGLVIEGFGVRLTNVALVSNTEATSDSSTISLQYTVTQDGEYYGSFKFNEIDSITITSTNPDNASQTLTLKSTMPYACQIGYLNAGDTVTITGTTDGKLVSQSTFMSCVYRLDSDIFDAGIETLRSNGTLDVESVSDTEITGTITANIDGIMYTSIPYEEGWSVYVDGEEQEAVPVCNNTSTNDDGEKEQSGSMLGIELEKGTHTIELKYSPQGFVPGVIISIICLAAFIAIIFLNRRRMKNKKVVYDIVLTPEEKKLQAEEEKKLQEEAKRNEKLARKQLKKKLKAQKLGLDTDEFEFSDKIVSNKNSKDKQ
ncbi:MAG: YfhO family protein [Ruminococcus sp.]|nr:YfhO family protein [Ruminococcus sp.]